MPYATRAALLRAARELAQEGVLLDNVSDDDVLIYTFERCDDYETDLEKVTDELRNHIISTYNKNLA